MPVLDPVLAHFPTPEDFFVVQLAVEIHQPLLEPLEHAADLLQLEQVVVDLVSDGVDLAAQVDLLRRLAPVGLGLGCNELVARHQIAPLRVQRHAVGDDALHERKRTIGFCESEILTGHNDNIRGKSYPRTITIPWMNSGWGMNPTTRLLPSTTTMVDLICASLSSSCSILNPVSSVSGVTTTVSRRACTWAEHSFGSCPAATHCVTMSRSEMVPR